MLCISDNVVRLGSKLSRSGRSLKTGAFAHFDRWPRSCLNRDAMELVKGRKPRRADRRDEEMFRYPTGEEIWEVPFSEEGEREEREVPPSPRGTSGVPRRAA